jgi:hypothetical protein
LCLVFENSAGEGIRIMLKRIRIRMIVLREYSSFFLSVIRRKPKLKMTVRNHQKLKTSYWLLLFSHLLNLQSFFLKTNISHWTVGYKNKKTFESQSWLKMSMRYEMMMCPDLEHIYKKLSSRLSFVLGHKFFPGPVN